MSLPLWSARALLEAPDVLRAIHADYLDAGADAITADTFRTHRRTLATAGLGDRAAALTRRAVEIARAAVAQSGREALVLGSVAPLEDCYRPDLVPGDAACRIEHDEHVAALCDAGVDVVLIETMNALREARAAIAAARRRAPGRWAVSFCTRTEGPPGVLLGGEPLAPLLAELADAWAVGVNCIGAPAMAAQVEHLRAALPGHGRVAAYANVGLADERGNWIITDAVSPERYAGYARQWRAAGATAIGGCCGTTPATIRAVRAAFPPFVP